MDNKQALVAAAYHEAVDAIKQEVLVDTTGPDIYITKQSNAVVWP